jgi:hypothetical protein
MPASTVSARDDANLPPELGDQSMLRLAPPSPAGGAFFGAQHEPTVAANAVVGVGVDNRAFKAICEISEVFRNVP